MGRDRGGSSSPQLRQFLKRQELGAWPAAFLTVGAIKPSFPSGTWVLLISTPLDIYLVTRILNKPEFLYLT